MAVDNAAIDRLIQALDRNIQSDRESLKRLQDLFGRGGGRGKGRSDVEKEMKLREEQVDVLRKSTGALDKLYDRIVKAKVQWEKNGSMLDEHRNALETNISKVLQSTSTISKADKKRLTEIREQLKSQTHNKHTLNSLSKITERTAQAETVLYKEKIQAAKHTHRFQRLIHQSGDKLKDFGERMTSMSTAVALIGVGIAKSFNVIEDAARTQAPVMALMQGEFTDFAERFGISQADFLRIYDQNTATILGATKNMSNFHDSGKQFLKSFKSVSEELYNVTGSYTQSLELAAESFSVLGLSGVKMSFQEMQDQITGPKGVANSLKFLARASDRSVPEITNMLKTMMQDESMRGELLGLGEKERKNRMSSIVQQTEQLRIQGLTIERAMEFQKTLASINQQQDPKSFMKGIARTAALAGGMGIGGQDTNKFMQEMLKAPGDPSRDKAFIQSFVTQLEKQQSKLVGADDLGTRMMGMQMKSLIPPEIKQLMAAGSTAAEDQFKLGGDQVKILSETKDEIRSGTLGIMTEVKQVGEIIKSIFTSTEASLFGGVASGLMSAAKNLLDAAVYWKVLGGKMPGGMMGKASGLATAAKGAAGTSIGALSTSAGGLATAAGGVALAGAAGYGVGTLVDKAWEKFAPESRAGFSDLLGHSLDTVASLWSDDAKHRLDVAEKLEQQNKDYQERLAMAIDKQTKLMEDQNGLLEEQKTIQQQTAKNTANKVQTVQQTGAQSVQAIEDQTDQASKALRTQEIRASGRRSVS